MARLVLLALMVGAAPHPLASDDVATRRAAAIAWSAAHGPVKFQWKGEEPCARVVAPSEARCAKVAWACSHSSGSGGCDGSSSEEEHLLFVDSPERPTPEGLQALEEQAPPLLLVRAESSLDTTLDCEMTTSGLGFIRTPSPEARRAAEATWAAEEKRARAQCIKEARRNDRASRMTFRCDVLVVNPCRREAFVRCSGKNVAEDPELPRLGVHRFTW